MCRSVRIRYHNGLTDFVSPFSFAGIFCRGGIIMPEIGPGFIFIIAIIFLIIFVSLQFTLNLILRELKEIRKYLSYVRDEKNDRDEEKRK